MQALAAFIAALPELIKLVQNLLAQAKRAEEDRKVKEDLRRINQAFKDGNAQALHDIFINNTEE